MFTTNEIFKKFELEVNKNDTNANVKISKGVFVILFNQQKRQWLNDISNTSENSDYIEDIEELLEVDSPLIKLNTSLQKDDFKLPENFFKRVSSYSIAKSGNCLDVMVNWAVKPKDINVLLQNENQKPSFNYRETLMVLNNGKVTIYKDKDFTIEEAYLTYYREPLDLDIAGYTKLDGSASINQVPDLSDINIEHIIARTAAEALRNTEASEQLQIALQRQQLNEQN